MEVKSASEVELLRAELNKLTKTVKEMKARLDVFEPTEVEKRLGTFGGRVKVVDEIIKTCVLRATVATELSFKARNSGSVEREFITSDVIYALDLPHSFWQDNYSEMRTIDAWVSLIRSRRLGAQSKAA